jgi:hypothetical protein
VFNRISKLFERTKTLSSELHEIARDQKLIQRRVNSLAVIERERYVRELLSSPLYESAKRLERYGAKVYSQNDEDGIIQEIFNRIETGSRTFVEFGVEDGLENNTLKLLLDGWRGLWIEGSEGCVRQIAHKFRDVIASGRLQVKEAFITRDNINALIAPHFQGEIDLLSIDIDGNDIYILDAVTAVNPRVIIVEYNGKFPPPMNVAQEYAPNHTWDGSDYGGSSLEAITKVAAEKGYCLVGCGIVGVNAFFVRRDLTSDKFDEPFTAKHHYQPARYFLWQTFVSGHPPNWGPYTAV